MNAWLITGVLAVGAYVLRLTGVLVGRHVGLGNLPAEQLLRYLGPAVIGGLIAVSTVGTGGDFVIDARLAGVAAGLVALVRRAPVLAVVAVAVLVTALVRTVSG